MEKQTPTIGRIVIYSLSSEDVISASTRSNQPTAAAIIVSVNKEDATIINLQAFTDDGSIMWKKAVVYNSEKQQGTWHWPEIIRPATKLVAMPAATVTERIATPQNVIERIAEICHEVNRAYCEGIGDFSQGAWANAPAWQKESAINGVKFHIRNPFTTPAQSHKNWLNQKAIDGWGYGPVKDELRKQHPCFVEWADLPKEQRAKDYVFRQVVHSLLPVFNITINQQAAKQDEIIVPGLMKLHDGRLVPFTDQSVNPTASKSDADEALPTVQNKTEDKSSIIASTQ